MKNIYLADQQLKKVTLTKDLTYYNVQKNKVTALRGLCGKYKSYYVVVQGETFYGGGLKENYKEFEKYTDALDYFNSIKQE
jgi:hypothetical protein